MKNIIIPVQDTCGNTVLVVNPDDLVALNRWDLPQEEIYQLQWRTGSRILHDAILNKDVAKLVSKKFETLLKKKLDQNTLFSADFEDRNHLTFLAMLRNKEYKDKKSILSINWKNFCTVQEVTKTGSYYDEENDPIKKFFIEIKRDVQESCETARYKINFHRYTALQKIVKQTEPLLTDDEEIVWENGITRKVISLQRLKEKKAVLMQYQWYNYPTVYSIKYNHDGRVQEFYLKDDSKFDEVVTKKIDVFETEFAHANLLKETEIKNAKKTDVIRLHNDKEFFGDLNNIRLFQFYNGIIGASYFVNVGQRDKTKRGFTDSGHNGFMPIDEFLRKFDYFPKEIAKKNQKIEEIYRHAYGL